MTDTVHNEAPAAQAGKRRSVSARIARCLAVTGASIILLLIALLVFTETRLFRDMLKDAITDAVESSMRARLSIGSLEGNIFSGWKLNDVSFVTERGPLFSTPTAVLRYNLFALPFKQIELSEITLYAPRITLTRGASGKWNFEGLSRDTTETPPGGEPFDWRIIVRNLGIVSAEVAVWDSTAAASSDPAVFDPTHLLIGNLDVSMKADIAPDVKRIAIDNICFRNYSGPVSLESLSGDLLITRRRAAVENLALRTERSRFLLSARLDGADILADSTLADISRRSIAAVLEAEALDTRDLAYFFPSLYFLGSAPSVSLAAGGSLRHLTVNKLELNTLDTRLSFAGELRNLAGGGDLFIDVSSPGSVIRGADVAAVLPGLRLPDYSGLGDARFDKLLYRGTPTAFHAEVDMSSGAGDLKGEADMDLTGPEIAYGYQVETRKLDLSRVLGQPLLSSSLNLKAVMKGRGFSPGSMSADVRVSAEPSRFQRYATDTLTAEAGIRPDSLRATAAARFGRSALDVSGEMRFRGDSIGAFGLRLRSKALDLAQALDNDGLKSDLTLDLEMSGDGISLSEDNLSARLILAPSRFSDYSFGRDTVRMELDQRDRSNRRLTLNTGLLTFSLRGAFDLPRFARDAALRADSIAAALRRLAPGRDSTTAAADRGKPVLRNGRLGAAPPAEAADTASYMNAAFSLQLRDTEPLQRLLGAQLLFARGGLEGAVRGGAANFDIDANARISDFYYIDSTRDMIAAGLRLDLNLRGLKAAEPLRDLALDVRCGVQEVGTQDMQLKNLLASVAYTDGIPRFQLRGQLDTLLRVSIDGEATASSDYRVSLPLLQLSYMGRVWSNSDTVRLRMDDSSLTVTSLTLARNGAVIDISGRRGFGGDNDLKIRASGLPMAELDTLLRREIDPTRGGLSGTASLDADIRGNDGNPVLALELFVDRPGYEQFRFERFKLEATYSSQLLEVYSELFTASDGIRRPPVFFASGSLPVHLAFTGGGARVTGDANLRASMKHFPLALLESFVGLFSPLEGTADADIEIGGPADDLRYNGRISVSDARGRLAMNNMWYRINLDVRPEGDVINIHDISVRNDPSDWSEGELSAKGSIKMKGFALEGVAAEVNGQLKVLRRESRAALRSVYGDLYITTKGTPVRLKADPDGSDLSGVVQVLQGNLTYAGGAGDKGPQQYQNINYVEVDDLQKEKEASLGGGGRARVGSLMGRALAAGQTDTSAAEEKAMSLNLRYDIAVSTDGPLRVVMPFSSLSQVELNARLNIEQLRVSNALGPGKFTGSVSLGPESYFLMLGKRFDATGSLEFMGDPANPDLRLRAVYSDSHTDQESGATRKVYVVINITGNREKPELVWDMRWDSPESQSRPRAGDVQSDAFSFILTGLFTDELTSSDRNRIMDQTDAIVSAMASSIISSTASEFLAKAGLQNVFHRLEVGNLNTRDVRLKVTGGIGRVIATYDGKINNLGSSEITFEIPMSMFFPRFGFGRMVVQASRRTTSSTLETGASIPETAVYELKLLYRISF